MENQKIKSHSVRFPAEMFERLNVQAKSSFRSVSSEIIYRLQLIEEMEKQGEFKAGLKQCL